MMTHTKIKVATVLTAAALSASAVAETPAKIESKFYKDVQIFSPAGWKSPLFVMSRK